MSYKIAYKFDAEAGEFTRDQLEKEGRGGCDAFILISLIFPEDGGLSTSISTVDGRKPTRDDGSAAPIDPVELFKAWVMIAKNLSEDPELSEGKRNLCADLFETVRLAIVGGDS